MEFFERNLRRQFNLDGFSGDGSEVNLDFPLASVRLLVKEPFSLKRSFKKTMIHLAGNLILNNQ